MDQGLDVVGVSKTYGSGPTEVRALEAVSLAVAPGQLTAVIGPSGSGKSTLLAIVGTLLTPTAGEVVLNGRPISALRGRDRTRYRRDALGFVFQANNLIPFLTARENVRLPTELGPLAEPSADRRTDALLRDLGLADRADALAGELSGGERQRVAIARALVRDPQLLLVDEPTANLDSATGTRIVDVLRAEIRERKKVAVMVTHDTAIAAMADAVVELHDGRVAHHRTP